MQRTQHRAFGKELRALCSSKKTEDREIAGIVISELKALDEAKSAGTQHPKEDQLKGNLSEIRALKIYRGKYSIRVYFTTIDGFIWMLCIDESKRRDHVDDGMEQRLLERLAAVKAQCNSGKQKKERR